jgi:imidazolonepropionase
MSTPAPDDATAAAGASLVVERIGRLVTNDERLDLGPTGELHDAWVVIAGGRIEAVGIGSPPAGDERLDVEGRAVLPGFVDSHTHLVFAGDRGDEFAARMAGWPYEAGGIRTTTAATRAASDAQLLALARGRRDEARRSGITTVEIKSGYGLTPADESRTLAVARRLTDETTFLGAHVVPFEYEGRVDDYVELVCTEMLAACAPHARWIDAFCERGAFDADQCRAVLDAGRVAGLGLRLHANQLGPGPGVQLAVELGCASADHCTYLDDADVAALAGGSTVATFLPATDFSTRQPYPDARRVLDAGGVVALATNCNPGSSYTTSMPFCIALAVRDLHMTIEEAVWAATAGGAAALRRTDIGLIAEGCRADLVVLDAPSAAHLVYRPGVALVDRTIEAGVTVWSGTGPALRGS